jgi:hypothetical protein
MVLCLLLRNWFSQNYMSVVPTRGYSTLINTLAWWVCWRSSKYVIFTLPASVFLAGCVWINCWCSSNCWCRQRWGCQLQKKLWLVHSMQSNFFSYISYCPYTYLSLCSILLIGLLDLCMHTHSLALYGPLAHLWCLVAMMRMDLISSTLTLLASAMWVRLLGLPFQHPLHNNNSWFHMIRVIMDVQQEKPSRQLRQKLKKLK